MGEIIDKIIILIFFLPILIFKEAWAIFSGKVDKKKMWWYMPYFLIFILLLLFLFFWFQGYR